MGSASNSATKELDELLLQASREVDRTLIHWALSLSPLDRLRAAMSSAASLEALSHARWDDVVEGESHGRRAIGDAAQ